MLIFKVMVCFLAVFNVEDYVGGLPTIQDSPDNHQAGQSARSASNQGVTNEPGNRRTELLDYAERDEEEVRRKVNHEIKTMEINPGVFRGEIREREDQLLKFRLDEPKKNENVPREILRKSFPTTDQFLDKSKSRNDRAMSSSLGAQEIPRFSSVYMNVDLDEKVNKKKEEFKNHLSAYVTDVLDTVATRKGSTSARTFGEKNKNDTLEAEEKVKTENPNNLSSQKMNVPVPEEDAKISASLKDENRQRKSVGEVVIWHQQSTNMRPTRTQHLVQNKRSPREGNLLKLPGYGGRRSVAKTSRAIEAGNRDANRRHFTADGSSTLGVNQLQFAGVNPVQINAAMAYSNRQPLNIDLSRALYQFGPAQLHALRGVFDKVPPSTKNFKPIAPKQVAYVPPRIVYETKIVPAPFMPFRTEQKTVEALSALLGKNPTQQLQGFNLILRKDQQEKPKSEIANPEISRQGIHDAVALSQAFVTPIPSFDINSGLAEEGSFRYLQDDRDGANEQTGRPFDQKTPQYSIHENIQPQENPFKTIPIVEEQEETQRGQPVVEKEVNPIWKGSEVPETTRDENEGRYFHQNEQGTNHGDGYASKYSFGYHVKDHENGNDFGHEETRDGVITNGRYHVLLPDGRLQNVKYHVDEGGYHAKVSYQLNPTV